MGRIMVLLAVVSLAAAPPAALTPEQVKLLRERDTSFQRALAARKERKVGEVIAGLEKALAINEHVNGYWHRYTERRHDELWSWRLNREGWDRVIDHRRRVLEIRERLDGTGHWRVVDARLALEEALAQAKRTPERREALKRAWLLNTQAGSLYQKGQAAKALPLAKQALKLYEEVQGRRHPDYAASLNNLALLYQAAGDYRAALPLFQQALKVREEVQGRGHPDYAESLNNLAVLHKDMGDHRAALPLLQRALKLRKEALGRSHPLYAASLNSLADLHHTMGDRKAALLLFQQALKLTEEVLGRQHPNFASILNNLAMQYQDMGDYKLALPLLQQALKLTEEVQGRRHPDYAGSLSNLAGLYSAMGDHKAALPLFQQALKLTEEVLGRRHPAFVRNLNNLATLHKDMGDHKAALPLFQQALKLREEVLGRRHPAYSISLNNLASLYQDMGDLKAALPLAEQALKLREEVQGRRHPDYAATLSNLAGLYKAMGDLKVALPLAEQALAIVADQMRDNATVQSDRQQFAAIAAVRLYLDNRLALPDDDKHASAAERVLSWKGQVLLRQQGRRLFLRLATDKDSREAARRLETVTHQLAALRLSGSATRERLRALEKEQDDTQAALSRLSADFRAARAKERVTPAMLAKALPEGTVLIDYLFHGGRLTAFVHRRGKPHVRVPLGRAAPVLKAIADWRPLLIAGRDGGMPAAALKRLVWTPLEKHLEGAKVVLVSPDGALGMVPFAALPGKKSGSYLIEDVAVAVVPVPSAIPDLLAPKKDRLGPTLLIVGDLRYDPGEKVASAPAGVDDRAAPRTGREKWSRLPGTAVEALAVRSAFEKLFKDGKATALAEGDATKAIVRQALSRVRYAHLATHGYFAPETVRSALAPDKGRPDERREVSGWHPLLLSGLALSDANREPKPGEEDGILTALEVSEMDLSRLELAVLSACETGLGYAAGGEGLLGMQRAFQVAGARSVIASLWKVDDRATQALMSEFYARAWDTKTIIGRAEALRQAQLAMLRDGVKRGIAKAATTLPAGGKGTRLPPAFWAAFVLSGDWR